jgi:hypothetical protein
MHALSNYNGSNILVATPESDLNSDQLALNANFKNIVTGYVPYTGATGNVDLGANALIAATVECNTVSISDWVNSLQNPIPGTDQQAVDGIYGNSCAIDFKNDLAVDNAGYVNIAIYRFLLYNDGINFQLYDNTGATNVATGPAVSGTWQSNPCGAYTDAGNGYSPDGSTVLHVTGS